MDLTKRELFAVGASTLLLAAGAAYGQEDGGGAGPKVPRRKATTKLLFKAPSGFPNALAPAPEGVWVAEQKPRGDSGKRYGLTDPPDATENLWLMDWNGKVLKTLVTGGRNTSGLCLGGGYLWSCALVSMPGEIKGTGPQSQDGIYQIDMNTGKTLSHHQLPLGPADDGGGIHGAFWQDGKIWVFANRINAILRINPVTWNAEFLIPVSNKAPRYHGIAWDNGAIWIVTGNATASYKTGTFGLEKYDAASGRLLEIVDFAPGSADPHGLIVHNGKLISCDAGIHPGWPVGDSPTWGNIFEIDIAEA